jgi:outer membrane protein TolC
VTWTLFDTFLTKNNVREAELVRERLVAQRRVAVLQIDADVRAAHARLERLLAERPPLERVAAVARDNLKIVTSRYEAGEALVIELIDAQVQVIRAESSVVDNAVSIAQADAELRAATGRL